jgi:hypothetical protein
VPAAYLSSALLHSRAVIHGNDNHIEYSYLSW